MSFTKTFDDIITHPGRKDVVGSWPRLLLRFGKSFRWRMDLSDDALPHTARAISELWVEKTMPDDTTQQFCIMSHRDARRFIGDGFGKPGPRDIIVEVVDHLDESKATPRSDVIQMRFYQKKKKARDVKPPTVRAKVLDDKTTAVTVTLPVQRQKALDGLYMCHPHELMDQYNVDEAVWVCLLYAMRLHRPDIYPL